MIQIKFTPVKTYKTAVNATKAIEKLALLMESGSDRFFIHTDEDGRFFPVVVWGKKTQPIFYAGNGFTVI